jgi:hypothetical protein
MEYKEIYFPTPIVSIALQYYVHICIETEQVIGANLFFSVVE